VRVILLICLAACSKSSPKAEPASTCPVGDGINVSVYGFLEREISEAEDQGRTNTRAMLAREAELAKSPDMKPLRASIAETEMSNALTTLCAGAPGCRAIGLYNASGLAVALSSGKQIAPLGFDDKQWAQLTALPDGGRADQFVVFHAEHGIALCIVD
jgi:hypothetical protein